MTPDGNAEDVPPFWHEAIDRMLDGEAVDATALRRALNESDARDYFVDAVVLRQLTRDITPSQFAAVKSPPSALVRGARWLAAVLILVVGAGLGYVYGQKFQEPPLPGSVEVVLDQAPAPPAPEPTRHIRFEPGVNWMADAGSK